MVTLVKVLRSNAAGAETKCTGRQRFLVAASVLAVALSASTAAQGPAALAPGAVIHVHVFPPQAHRYALLLRSGESAELVIDQRGVDVAVDVLDPGVRLLDSIDSPNGRNGPEPVFHIATETGSYSIVVRPLTGEPAGDITIGFQIHRNKAATDELLRQRREVRSQAVAWLRPRSMALPPAALRRPVPLSLLDTAAAEARVIGLGEATHGSRELNDVRLSLVKRLIEQHGYRAVALEDSSVRWRDLADYVSGAIAAPPPDLTLEWGWIGRRSRHELLLWVRQWNLDHPNDKVVVVGVDAANVLSALGEGIQRKGIYWGHNSHVSAFSAGWEPTGALLRETLGCGYEALATTFGRGSFLAQIPNDVEDRLVVSTVGEPQEESIENVLAATGPGPRLIWWSCESTKTDVPAWLRELHPMRWIGGLYAPETAPTGSYQPYRLTQSFDGIIYLPMVAGEQPGPPRPLVPARERPSNSPQ